MKNIRFGAVTLLSSLLIGGLLPASLQAQSFTFSSIAPRSEGLADGVEVGEAFNNPLGVAVDGVGNLYVADQQNNCVLQIRPCGTNWTVTTIAGGVEGSLDGTNTGAQFSGPTGIAMDAAGALYVADQYNNLIRKLTLSGTNWIVSTIAGSAGVSNHKDGANSSAGFSNPVAVAVDSGGNIFVADEMNNAIRKITQSGANWIVTTVAGGTMGSRDGANTNAQFFGPCGVAVDGGGRVFVADQFNNTIRLVTPAGSNWIVTTIAGETISGRSDGVGVKAHFNAPVSVAVDTNETVYVSDQFNNAIRKLTALGTNWAVATIGGGSQGASDGVGANASFNLPFGVVADAYGDIFVADSHNNALRLGVSAAHPPATGALEVLISPANVVSAGAEWQVDGGIFHTNGTVLNGLLPGDHFLSFQNVEGFTTPAPETIAVTAHQTALAEGDYPSSIANAGSLQVKISPLGAVRDGAQWRVDNDAWQTNRGVVAGLAVGSHIISFAPVAGWTAPSAERTTITNSQTSFASGLYMLQTGALQVTLLPATVVAAGAKWRIDGGTFRASSMVLTGLLPGLHTVSFNTVLGWATPLDQTITVTNTLTTTALATYRSLSHSNILLQLGEITLSQGGPQFILSGPPGRVCVIQVSSDLTAWSALVTNTIPAASSIRISDPTGGNQSSRFYRALTQ